MSSQWLVHSDRSFSPFCKTPGNMNIHKMNIITFMNFYSGFYIYSQPFGQGIVICHGENLGFES